MGGSEGVMREREKGGGIETGIDKYIHTGWRRERTNVCIYNVRVKKEEKRKEKKRIE